MHLTDCFMNIFAYVAYFTKTVGVKQPAFEQIKADILRLMSDVQNRMAQGSFAPDDFDLARFAVVAWVDESIMNSGWNHRDKWQKELLQRQYYQTTDAGEIFFDRLNTIGPHQRDVREVYYLCLALGFKGRYCHAGDEFLLDQLKTSNLKLLTGSSMGIPSLSNTELVPEAYPVTEAAVTSRPRADWFSKFTLACLGFPVLLFVGLFLIYTFILRNLGNNFF
jgi:type VI secretion system protein ImpK